MSTNNWDEKGAMADEAHVKNPFINLVYLMDKLSLWCYNLIMK